MDPGAESPKSRTDGWTADGLNHISNVLLFFSLLGRRRRMRSSILLFPSSVCIRKFSSQTKGSSVGKVSVVMLSSSISPYLST